MTRNLVLLCCFVLSLHCITAYQNTIAKRYVHCKEKTSGPRRNCKCFKNKGNADYDLCALNGIIAAYQVKWVNGLYSKWFVPRLNDISQKRNLFYRRCYPKEKVQYHRMWTYFYSHTHKYIVCRISSPRGQKA